MLVPYRQQRSPLFQCLDVLPLRSSSQDRSILIALAWLQGFRNAHREYLLLTENDLANLPLDWPPEKWGRAMFPHGRDSRMLHRRFFELGVLSQIMRELNSGDLYVEGSDRFMTIGCTRSPTRSSAVICRATARLWACPRTAWPSRRICANGLAPHSMRLTRIFRGTKASSSSISNSSFTSRARSPSHRTGR